ncbi:MAG: hypothetical protein B6244_11870 [Candidatus Cloacimonetes bacterium 4572_55]|nr:MAG: hypothetical protein B6244_11870 [Candidatus Cloacimonetes bacterium 4572_55]
MKYILAYKEIFFSMLIGFTCFGFLRLKQFLYDIFLWEKPGGFLDFSFDIIFLAILIVIIHLMFLARKARSHVKNYSRITLRQADSMDGLKFEHYVCKLMEYQGYQAEVTVSTGDQGVDVIARKGLKKYAVQVKRYTKSVSRHAVSDAVAGRFHYKCNRSMVVTNRDYTKGAKELAESTGCVLIDREILGKWIDDFRRDSARGKRFLYRVAFLLVILIIALLARFYLFTIT